jgi:hypothetical protein
MFQSRLTIALPTKNLSVRWFSLVFATFLIVASLLFAVMPVHDAQAQTHTCAPDPPALLPGNPAPAPAMPGSIMINEVLNLPHTTWNCSEPPGVYSQQKDTWIELYNTQNQPLDLYAAHAQFSLDGGQTWVLVPYGSQIAANDFLVIFPLAHGQSLPSAPTWAVMLEINGTIIDQASIPTLQVNQSYARIPDGSSNWELVGQPTIDATNDNSNQPVTPTPTKTPKPTRTPTPTKTPKSSAGGSTGGSSAPTSFGTQPAWGGVQFPNGAPPTLTGTASSTQSTQLLAQSQEQNAQTSQGNGQNSWWQSIALVLLGLLLLTVLVCCWRLFRTP